MENDDHFFLGELVVIHFSEHAQEAGCRICDTLKGHSQILLSHFQLLLNPDTFVQKVKEVHPDLIFLDYNEQFSSELNQLRQENSEWAEIPMVMTSGPDLDFKQKSEFLDAHTPFWIVSENESSPHVSFPLEGFLNLKRRQKSSILETHDFKQFVKNIKEYAIIMINRSGSIQDWNEGAAQIFGYHQNEILGKPFQILFAPEEVESGRPKREMKKATDLFS